ncbi:hypothetical protein B0H12DRAFT_1223394 [Mycena haematopus]|nr:hypothetical protein B0H12DRAFT_1223394 [Mycena haematopus]
MLSSFTTSKRRRGLRGKASREKLPAPSALPSTESSLYSLDPSSRASTSSLASTHTISRTSHATSMTSFSLASSGQCDSPIQPEISLEDRLTSPKQDAHPSPLKRAASGLSPLEIFKLRIAEGTHTRRVSSATLSTSPPVRVVRVAGRGGQGSRPRALPIDLNAPAPAPDLVMPLPPRELRRNHSESFSTTKQPARILGRGGLASRPRGLLISDSPQIATSSVLSPPIPPPPKTAALIQEVPRPPAVYRPSGRGGAGSRPRKVKPQAEEKKDDKDFKFPWKGKGKAKADVPDLSENALTRTDTQYSTVSTIAFAPAERQTHQRPISPDPLTPSNTSIASVDSFDAHLAHLQANRANKLARTLGDDFHFHGTMMANGRHPQMPGSAKLARSSSASVGNAPRESQVPSAEHSLYQQSSYGSLVTRRTDSPVPYSPMPSRSPQAHPDAPQYLDDSEDFDEYTEDDVSEMFTLPQSDDGPQHSLRSMSSCEMHVQPRLEVETDSEYGRADTPTQFTSYADSYGSEETPSPAAMQRFDSPFQTMPLFVVPWEPVGEPQAWSGEWNQKDMQSVIQSLRTLKSS